MATTTTPTPICGNPDHYEETLYCPHCELFLCCDWENCDSPDAEHDVPNCEEKHHLASFIDHLDTTTRDPSGNILRKDIEKTDAGWSVNVWLGGFNGLATVCRRYVYSTRQAARDGDISDDIGYAGRIA